MENLTKLIEENANGRFEPVFRGGRFGVVRDRETERFYCRRANCEAPKQWFRVEYVAAMQKKAWEDNAFDNARDEDEFTDAIAFCEVSGEVMREGIPWIVWFEICDED